MQKARGNGTRLRQARLRRGWTQTDLSALTGLAQSDLSALECGRRRAGPSLRRRLADAFGLPEAVLFASGDEPMGAGEKELCR